ncbi:MAG: porphobilinogen synthase, partial [Actinomycetota bacterium]
MTFPDRRLRRLRRTPAIRQLVAETRVGVDDLIAPLFVRENCENPQPIHSMPGVMQHSQESLREEVRQLKQLGVGGIILFGLPERKDSVGSEAWNPDGVVQVALKNLRDEHGDDIVAIADLCVDEYTDHGHCGIVTSSGEIDNDATLELYQKTALAQVEAGADMVAPSGMMDGQVAAIRQALDANG